jgi:hypothetical protein
MGSVLKLMRNHGDLLVGGCNKELYQNEKLEVGNNTIFDYVANQNQRKS